MRGETLEGWKEIIAFMAEAMDQPKLCERTVRRYVLQRDALPVYRRLGRVVANRQAVKAWLDRQTVHVAAKPAGRRRS